MADSAATVSVKNRAEHVTNTTFWGLPIARANVHILFSLDKPGDSLQTIYRLLARANGQVHLFPLGHPLVRLCARLVSDFKFDDTYVLRAVSYPSRPNEGGADINLRAGSASVFFAKLEEEKRVLKSVRFRAPTSESTSCEFTVGRVGYLSFHRGDAGPLLALIADKLAGALSDSVKPFEQARGRFVEFKFSEPLFVDRTNYHAVVEALSSLPRTSVALLHTNPYFHATLTNYEDGGQFDIFITGHSTIYVQGRAGSSPAAFLRIQDGLTESFRDAKVELEKPTHHSLRELLEGRV
jgi:hypothetical protein